MASASGFVVLTTVATGTAAILSLVALSTPNWHCIDAGSYHIRRGFFEECQVFSPTKQTCHTVVMPREDYFCGHKEELLENRHGWSATFAILATLGWFAAAAMPVAGWCMYSLLTIPSLAVNLASILCSCISVSIFVNTYDAWYYCKLEYCAYATYYLGMGEDCFTTRGYSFTLAILAICSGFLGAFASALLVRATRAEKIDHQGNAITLQTKALAARIAAIAAQEHEQELESKRPKDAQRQHKALPGDSDSPPRNEHHSHEDTPNGSFHGGGDDADAPAPPPRRSRGRDAHGGGPSKLPPAAPPAGGDWVWNPNSELYWSTQEFLYLDPVAKLYYDPKTSKWYNPVTDAWTD